MSEWENGALLRAIVEGLNHDEVFTAHSGDRWYASTVRAVPGRMAAST